MLLTLSFEFVLSILFFCGTKFSIAWSLSGSFDVPLNILVCPTKAAVEIISPNILYVVVFSVRDVFLIVSSIIWRKNVFIETPGLKTTHLFGSLCLATI